MTSGAAPGISVNAVSRVLAMLDTSWLDAAKTESICLRNSGIPLVTGLRRPRTTPVAGRRRIRIGRNRGSHLLAMVTPIRLRPARGACYASCMFTLRFAMRSATEDPAARADLYAAAVDMAAWAERPRGLAAILSQHHAVDDGYLPSPVPLAAAMAARTTRIPITVAALLLALYEPVKLAEDLAIVDLISRGRVSYVIGIGYRDEEFAMFGVERRRPGPPRRRPHQAAATPLVGRRGRHRRAHRPGHAGSRSHRAAPCWPTAGDGGRRPTSSPSRPHVPGGIT